MVVSEPVGLFLMPFSITIGTSLYDILNETGLIWVPFILVMAKTFVDARSQGQDEGAPATIAIRNIEVEFVGKFIILLLFAMPLNNEPEFKYKQYSIDSTPSFISGAESIEELKPNSKFANSYGHSSPPLGWGLVHEWATGLSNTVIAKMPCTMKSSECLDHLSIFELASKLSQAHAPQESTRRMISEFNQACYVKAIQRVTEIEARGETVRPSDEPYRYSPNTKFAYNSAYMEAVYLGMGSDEEVTSSLLIQPSSSWPSSIEGQFVTCAVAAKKLDKEIEKAIDSSSLLQEYAVLAQNYFNLFQHHGTKPPATYDNGINEVKKAVFSNAAAITYSMPLEDKSSLTDTLTRAAIPVFLQKTFFNNGQDTIADSAKNMAENSVSTLHLGIAAVGASNAYLEQVQLTHFMPTLIMITQSMIMLLAPMVVVLTGFKGQFLFRIVLFYISVTLTPMVFQIGLVVSDLLYAAVVSLEARTILHNSTSFIADQLVLVQHVKKIPVAMSALMNILFQIAGGKILRNYDAGLVDKMKAQVNAMYKQAQQVVNSLEKDVDLDLDENGNNEANLEKTSKIAQKIIDEAKRDFARKHGGSIKAAQMRRGYDAKQRYGQIKGKGED